MFISKLPFATTIRTPVLCAGLGLLLILGTVVISAHSLFALFSIEGLVIVVGGVIAVAYMSFPKEAVAKALQAVTDLFTKDPPVTHNLHKDLLDILLWARDMKDKDLRGFEDKLRAHAPEDPIARYGLNMVVSGYETADIRSMMETAADAAYEQASVPVEILDAMTSHAPAFGMVGTLVGMVMMLCQLGDNFDMASIGSSLAVSFLSTLYGVLSARMVYMPAASRLKQQIDEARFRHQFIVEGMVLLSQNKTPMVIRDRLNSFIRPEKRDYYNIFGEKPSLPHLRVVNA